MILTNELTVSCWTMVNGFLFSCRITRVINVYICYMVLMFCIVQRRG